MKRTTDLNVIQSNFHAFTWGLITKIHIVGEYTIAEYHPWVVDGCSVKTGVVNNKDTNFHCWVNGKDISMAADNLDKALITCMAYKYDGMNSQAAMMICRILQIN